MTVGVVQSCTGSLGDSSWVCGDLSCADHSEQVRNLVPWQTSLKNSLGDFARGSRRELFVEDGVVDGSSDCSMSQPCSTIDGLHSTY